MNTRNIRNTVPSTSTSTATTAVATTDTTPVLTDNNDETPSLIPVDIFIDLLQDNGIAKGSEEFNKKRTKVFLSNNRKYPQLYELANQIISYVERNRDVTFPRFPTKSHRRTHIGTVAKVIFTHREFKDNVFYLPQSVLSTHLRSK